MRARKGTFRLMPAPDHIVFMRHVGDDGRRDRVMVFGGAMMEGHFPGSSLIPFGSGFDGHAIAGVAYSRRLYEFSNGIEIGAEAGLAARFGRDLTGEAWAGFSLGHEGFQFGRVTGAHHACTTCRPV